MAKLKNADKSIRKPVQERAKKTVEAILTAATRVLGSDGIEGANTNKIAEKAGVGIASLYQYFKSKDQIIFALVDSRINNRLDVIRQSVEKNLSGSESLEETIAVVIRALVAAKLSNYRIERILEEQLPKSALKLLDPFDRKLIHFLTGVLEPHRSQLRSTNLEYSLFTVIQAVRGVMVGTSLYRPEYLQKDEMIDTLTRMVMAELKAD